MDSSRQGFLYDGGGCRFRLSRKLPSLIFIPRGRPLATRRMSRYVGNGKRIHQLRLDVCEAAGNATIADLTLSDHSGTPLMSWPTKRKNTNQ